MLFLFFYEKKKRIFTRFFSTASVRSRSLDKLLVPGVFLSFFFFYAFCFSPTEKKRKKIKRFFCTASVRSRSLDQSLVSGVLVQACLRAWWRTKRSWPLFSPTFFFSSSFSSFFSAFYFSPTSGNLPCVKICFPQYFGITRRNI